MWCKPVSALFIHVAQRGNPDSDALSRPLVHLTDNSLRLGLNEGGSWIPGSLSQPNGTEGKRTGRPAVALLMSVRQLWEPVLL